MTANASVGTRLTLGPYRESLLAAANGPYRSRTINRIPLTYGFPMKPMPHCSAVRPPIQLAIAFSFLIGSPSGVAQEDASPGVDGSSASGGQIVASRPGPVSRSVLSGSVVDFRGDSVADATVCFFSDDPSKPVFFTTTDTRGKFGSGEAVDLPVNLVVTAKSLSPHALRVVDLQRAAATQIRLLPGRRVGFELVDPAGEPVKGAEVRSVAWQGRRGLQLIGESDSSGHVVFRNAPGSDVSYVIRHDDYIPAQVVLTAGSKSHRVVLGPLTSSPDLQMKDVKRIGEQVTRNLPISRVAAQLDRNARKLSSVVNLDLKKSDWMQTNKLKFIPSVNASGVQSKDGFRIRHAKSKETEVSELRFQPSVSGDFDVEVGYELLVSSTGNAKASLKIQLGEEVIVLQANCTASTDPHERTTQITASSLPIKNGRPTTIDQEGAIGTFRIARRGETVYVLSRTPQSLGYRLVNQYKSQRAPVAGGGISLHVFSEPSAESSTQWRRIQVRAEAINDVVKLAKAEPDTTVPAIAISSEHVSMGGTWTLQASPVDRRLACIGNWDSRGANLLVSPGQAGPPESLLEGDLKRRYEKNRVLHGVVFRWERNRLRRKTPRQRITGTGSCFCKRFRRRV